MSLEKCRKQVRAHLSHILYILYPYYTMEKCWDVSDTSVCTPGLCEPPSTGSFSAALFPKSLETDVEEAQTENHGIHITTGMLKA